MPDSILIGVRVWKAIAVGIIANFSDLSNAQFPVKGRISARSVVIQKGGRGSCP